MGLTLARRPSALTSVSGDPAVEQTTSGTLGDIWGEAFDVEISGDIAGSEISRGTILWSDGNQPTIFSIETKDVNTLPDGRVDRITVKFTEPVATAGILATEFKIGTAFASGVVR